MTHPDYAVLLQYTDGALDGDALTELRAHLASCTRCAAVVRREQHIQNALMTMERSAPRDDFEQRVMARINASRNATLQEHGWRKRFVLSAVAVCTTVGIVLIAAGRGDSAQSAPSVFEKIFHRLSVIIGDSNPLRADWGQILSFLRDDTFAVLAVVICVFFLLAGVDRFVLQPLMRERLKSRGHVATGTRDQ
ncbi:MAG: zf-HC2 domain-containing protein [Bacteroidia bacterium]|nr:zf-HC2 domain-containing protein [Bacteroidia bacterium]